MTSRPINEDDLNSFVDERLDAVRHAEVLAYLASHPYVARRVDGYRRQREELRAMLTPIAEEPLPPELDLSRMIEDRKRPRVIPRWGVTAAAALVLLVGGTGGWILRDIELSAPGVMVGIAHDAATSYKVYAPDRIRPVEIRAEDRTALVEWTATQLGLPVAIPDLAASGYRLMGGRIVPTGQGPAAMFMYDDDRGTRLVMLARPMAAKQAMPMSPYSQGEVNGFAWADEGFGYSLVGPLDAVRLQLVADDARRQLINKV